jgi:hypothetical protein
LLCANRVWKTIRKERKKEEERRKRRRLNQLDDERIREILFSVLLYIQS